MNSKKINLSTFNGYPELSCQLIRPERYHEFVPTLPHCIARGCGSSYGDAALNSEGIVVSTARLNRFLNFDREQGVLVAEAGVTFDEICELILPAGWFLPVIPGMARISLGGAVAADVHGKNHLQQGSFGQHLLWIELVTASSERIRCSPTEHADLFWATVGGMGLTGFISTVCLKLKRVASSQLVVENKLTTGLSETLSALNDGASMHEYNVAWLDGQATQCQLAKGVIMTAYHPEKTPEKKSQQFKTQSITVPFKLPINVIHPLTVRLFNYVYYHAKIRRKNASYVSYQDYFFPLDKIKNWPYLYGKKGFIQYQCVFPLHHAQGGIENLLAIFHRENILCSLVVLKRFGKSNQAPLSFPIEGITIAIDMPFSEKLLSVLEQADELLIKYGGRVYLAKDARLSKEKFIQMYTNYLSWINIKRQIDPKNIFQSALSLRLGLYA